MGLIHDLSRPNIEDIKRRLRQLEAGSPMNNSAIGAGGIEVYDGGVINISNGGLIVNGSATVNGVLDITGTLNHTGTSMFSGQTFVYGPLEVTGDTNFDGTTDITGALNVTGPTSLDGVTDVGGAFTVTGPTEITGTFDVTGVTKLAGNTTVSGTLDVTGAMATKGTLSVEGITTLKNDLNVESGGRIKVGALTIEPIAGGQLNFTDGAISRSGVFGMLINDASAVELAAPTVKLAGVNLTVSNLPTTTLKANLYADPASGKIYRSTAA